MQRLLSFHSLLYYWQTSGIPINAGTLRCRQKRGANIVRKILLLGNPNLYEKSLEVKKDELPEIKELITDLHDTLIDYRETYGAGRAIAAPQIGARKRLVYMFIDTPIAFINPKLFYDGNETMEVMDDCMSFPNLLVKVVRHRKVTIRFKDIHFNDCERHFEDDLSELLQHEYDHLDGILATMRAIDNKSFFIK